MNDTIHDPIPLPPDTVPLPPPPPPDNPRSYRPSYQTSPPPEYFPWTAIPEEEPSRILKAIIAIVVVVMIVFSIITFGFRLV